MRRTFREASTKVGLHNIRTYITWLENGLAVSIIAFDSAEHEEDDLTNMPVSDPVTISQRASCWGVLFKSHRRCITKYDLINEP